MRGKLEAECCKQVKYRITPAGAGKTVLSKDGENKHQDHPRRCGENSVLVEPLGCLPGSPPQVRGKLHRELIWMTLYWITPAGAGKTTVTALKAEREQDHPRRCGENSRVLACRLRARGSPPQVRGKQPILGMNIHAVRITPAGAGKTGYAIN